MSNSPGPGRKIKHIVRKAVCDQRVEVSSGSVQRVSGSLFVGVTDHKRNPSSMDSKHKTPALEVEVFTPSLFHLLSPTGLTLRSFQDSGTIRSQVR